MENDTVFGKIIRGEIPATKVYENEKFLAFLDINPVAKGHTLLIPKEKYTWIHDVPNELLAESFIKAKEIILAMKDGIPCDYVQIGVVGNEVPHFHIHLIPRSLSEEVLQTNRPHMPYRDNKEASLFANKIKEVLK
ncbi:MAG: HIT domain-containing protein [Candidatus Pacebacteria bacterium]|nr:HIT domain-containing protein [Candidatus Paceibacterota bacterium]